MNLAERVALWRTKRQLGNQVIAPMFINFRIPNAELDVPPCLAVHGLPRAQ
jgi:hypothetical protein